MWKPMRMDREHLQTTHSPVALSPSSRQVQQARCPQGVAVVTCKSFTAKNYQTDSYPSRAQRIQTKGAAVSKGPALIYRGERQGGGWGG